jgi:hypothetical protein
MKGQHQPGHLKHSTNQGQIKIKRSRPQIFTAVRPTDEAWVPGYLLVFGNSHKFSGFDLAGSEMVEKPSIFKFFTANLNFTT